MKPRIIAGKFKKLSLDVPDSARPFTDRVKQSMFDTLNSFIGNSLVLDLYSGSGNLGIEAVSRGAKHAYLVDIDTKAINMINSNISKTGELDSFTTLNIRAEDIKENINEKFDLIFVDPPFEIVHQVDFETLVEILVEDGIIVYKVPSDEAIRVELPDKLEILLNENFGNNTLLYLKLRKY